ncbi:MAG TPA: hypothetical protein DCY26_10465 [Hyphomonas sp.]|nr:hypothetical protein [Hyphomonas sp.]
MPVGFMKRVLAMLSDARGSVMPVFAISILAIISLAGAAIALSFDSRAANNLQIAADESALAGATAFLNAASPRAEDRLKEAQVSAEALARANANFSLAKLDVGAVTEDAYGQKTEIEVALKFTPANPAAQLAGRNANIAIERHAAASATWGFPLCILGLQGSSTGLSTSGEANLTADNCIVWTNSTGSRSMEFKGGRATTKYFCASGNAYVASATVTPRPHEKCEPIPDPLASWVAPATETPDAFAFPSTSKNKSRDDSVLASQLALVLNMSGLKTTTKALLDAMDTGNVLSDAQVQTLLIAINTAAIVVGGNDSVSLINKNGVFNRGAAEGLHVLEVAQILGLVDNLPETVFFADSYLNAPNITLSPGTYPGLDIMSGHVKLKPGVYHIVGAPLTVRRRATLTGEGVTIVLHGDDATISVLDQARLTLSAPTYGESAGFAIAENRKAKLTKVRPERSRLTGSGKVSMIGTIYLPRQQFSVTGKGAADQASPLLQLVAYTIDLNNKGALRIQFDPNRTEVPMTIMPAREARLIR